MINISDQQKDKDFLALALRIAQENPDTITNKMVGAIVVKEGIVVGVGFRKTIEIKKVPYKDITYHAEHMALIEAGSIAKGATIYTTLEPCTKRACSSEFDITTSCCEFIIKAGVSRVVIGCLDDDFGSGGAKLLMDNGIELVTVSGIDKDKFKIKLT